MRQMRQMKLMKLTRQTSKFSLILLFTFLWACSQNWNYKNQQNWKKHFKECGGQYQSPIDIDTAISDAQLKPLFIEFYDQKDSNVKVVFTGKTLYIAGLQGTVVTPDPRTFGHTYQLSNIYFHFPSEHTVKGKHYDGELQFINVDTAGNVMVLSVFIEQGKRNEALDEILKYVPKHGKSQTIAGQLSLSQLLPSSVSYWYYLGSLTAPPCKKDVKWFVMKTPIEASKEQIAEFTRLIGGKNRVVQPLNGRQVKEF